MKKQSFNEETLYFQALSEWVNLTLEKHVPTNKWHATANQAPYIKRKVSCTRNKFSKTRSQIDRKAYYKQRNGSLLAFEANKSRAFVSLLGNWSLKCKPFSTDKTSKTSRIT